MCVWLYIEFAMYLSFYLTIYECVCPSLNYLLCRFTVYLYVYQSVSLTKYLVIVICMYHSPFLKLITICLCMYPSISLPLYLLVILLTMCKSIYQLLYLSQRIDWGQIKRQQIAADEMTGDHINVCTWIWKITCSPKRLFFLKSKGFMNNTNMFALKYNMYKATFNDFFRTTYLEKSGTSFNLQFQDLPVK